MRRILFLLSITFILSACGTSYQAASPVDRLTSGMSKYDVEYIMGRPVRVLAINRTPQGIQEVLEYCDPYRDYYALEFWNDYLVNCEYMNYSNPSYVYAPYAYPSVMPSRGRPIVIIGGDYRPSRSNYSRSSGPTYRSSGSSSDRTTTGSRSSSSGRSSGRSTSTSTRSGSRTTTSSDSSSTRGSSSTESSSRSSSSRTSTRSENSSENTRSSGRSSDSTSSTRSSSR